MEEPAFPSGCQSAFVDCFRLVESLGDERANWKRSPDRIRSRRRAIPERPLDASSAGSELRWNAVMGRRLVYGKKAVAPCSWHMHALVILMLTFTFLAPSDSCQVYPCWDQFDKTVKAHDLAEGPNSAYCHALITQMECIRATSRRCRGNLNYHTMSSLVMKRNNEYNCSNVVIMQAETAPPITKPKTRPPVNQACVYHGKMDYQLCALFGDPHLRTFLGAHQTCKVVGAWPLVDNAYLAVQVTNDPVLPGTSAAATATSKVTVIIKGGTNQCAQTKTYEAQVGNLPSAFIDGTHHSGTERSVRLKVKEVDRHVEIVIRYIATTIVVRQVGDFLTVAIRMPKEVVFQGVVDEGLQLCTRGCPSNEQIDYVPFLWTESPSTRTDFGSVEGFGRSAALNKCRAENLTDFYLDSCVFDLMTTGDDTFRLAASKAMHDLKALTQNLYYKLPNRTSLPTLPPPPVAVSSPGVVSGSARDGSVPSQTASSRLVSLLVLCLLVTLMGQRPS